MEFNYNLASTSPSIAMIGALLSFAGVGLLILIFSERMLNGLINLIYYFGNQILRSRRLFSKNYIEKIKASNNQIYIKQNEIQPKNISLTEQKKWLEKILKMKV
tara:strand:+ start:461 stop:772 length:312 start_codon:yes stop_codon:yes gene_type:complete